MNSEIFKVSHSSETQRMRTKAGKKGYSTGRWTKLEHFVFVEGKQSDYFRIKTIWKELEEGRETDPDSNKYADLKSCLKVLHLSDGEMKGKRRCKIHCGNNV